MKGWIFLIHICFCECNIVIFVYRTRWMVLFQLISSGGISRLVCNHLNMVEHTLFTDKPVQKWFLSIVIHTHTERALLHSNCNLLNFFHWHFTDLHPLKPASHSLYLHSFSPFFPSDTDDSGLVDVYDNQCHVWVPGIQPWTPVTQLLGVLVGPCMFKYSYAPFLGFYINALFEKKKHVGQNQLTCFSGIADSSMWRQECWSNVSCRGSGLAVNKAAQLLIKNTVGQFLHFRKSCNFVTSWYWRSFSAESCLNFLCHI